MISHPQESGRALDYVATAPHLSHSPILVLLAWAVVALPAAWGIYMTARTSVQLFKPTPAAAATTPTLTNPTPAQTPIPANNNR
ncbi:MAG TPA: hypothetical protein VLJ39_15600 [Tepidisphaeraceae bacterium]|nr:hypothetical protein [Tepidisphaeraceae bacterium]